MSLHFVTSCVTKKKNQDVQLVWLFLVREVVNDFYVFYTFMNFIIIIFFSQDVLS